jgi:glycosyltransferase involved in cell wall biosynthesis
VTDPFISIIIPTFNAQNWIAETLDSAIGQTLAPDQIEIILVDNGSQDRTSTIAAEIFAGRGINATVASENRRGPSHARNHGLQLARGAWIQFLDADDLLHPDKLSLQYYWAQKSEPKVGLIYSSWQDLVCERGSWIVKSPRMPALETISIPALLCSLLTVDGFFQVGSALFRRSAVLDVGGFRDVGLIEDVDLYLRLTMAGWGFSACTSQTPLFAYRRHRDGSLSTGKQLEFADGVARNASMLESWAREHGELNRSLTARITECYFQAARAYAGHDWRRFETVVTRIERLISPAIPPGPRLLTILSGLIGYRAAEHVAYSWRALKRAGSWAQLSRPQ